MTADWQASALTTADTLSNTRFLRHYLELSRQFRFVCLGLSQEVEDNQRVEVATDSLLLNSFRFHDWELFAERKDSSNWLYRIYYKQRHDWLPDDNVLVYGSLAKEAGLSMRWQSEQGQYLKLTANYRELLVEDSVLVDDDPQKNLLARAEHQWLIRRGLLRLSTVYEQASGLERKNEFTYVEVAAGQGIYHWIDYNENGVKELDEFETAVFEDQADHIRVLIPSNEYIRSYRTAFSELFAIEPMRLYKPGAGLSPLWWQRFSNQLAYKLERKTLAERFLPFEGMADFSRPDANLLSLQAMWRNRLIFNKSSRYFLAEYRYQDQKNRQLLLSGLDTHSQSYHALLWRWRPQAEGWNIFLLESESRTGGQAYQSDYFVEKNYRINYFNNQVSLTYQPVKHYEFRVAYHYAHKENVLRTDNRELAEKHDWRVAYQHRFKSGGGQLKMMLSYVKWHYNASRNGSLAYIMLEGLKPGANTLWSIGLQRRLAQNLELSLNYEGRLAEGSQIIHRGGIQLRAMF